MTKFRNIVSAAVLVFSTAAMAQAPAMVVGKVTKIDTATGKVTIDHQKIPNLEMPAMTMVFKAADPAMLTTVKAGDRIKFNAESVNGELTVTKIDKAK